MATPGFYPIKGGTETMVRNISLELNRMDVHVDIMTFNMDRKWNPKWRGQTEEIDGITVYRIPALNWLPIQHSPRITLGVNLVPGRFTNLLKQYDIIHFHEEDFSFPLFSLLVSKPKILHFHGLHVGFYKRYHLSRIALKHLADLYISISRQMELDLAELGVPRSRIGYLPNAVNVNLFRPKGEKEDNLILYIGRITFNKGVHVLLESLCSVTKSVHLVIIGPMDCSPMHHHHILKLIERENQKGKHRITYLGGLPHEEVIDWYQKAAIFILPSFMEAFPVVLLEALSCETPVIATPVGGVPEVVRDSENGILVPANNPQKLAEAIEHLLNNREVRIRLGMKGREWVMKNFSSDVFLKKLCKIYEKVINCS